MPIRPGGDRRPDVQAHDRIDRGSIENTLFDHAKGAGDFLVGLEDEFNRSGKGVRVLRQNFGRHQQHGHVGIVAAGVHHPRILGTVRELVFLGHRQSVHIGPEHQHRTGTRSFQQGDYPGPGNAAGGHPQVLKVGFDHLCGAMLFESQLGMLVEIPAQRDQFVPAGFDLFGYLLVHS